MNKNQRDLAPIIIVLIVIALFAGGILAWQYLRVPEDKVKEPEDEKIGEELIKVNIYLHNRNLYTKLEQEICPREYCPDEMYKVYGVDDCAPVFSVIRKIPKPKNNNELIQLLLEELLKGPTAEEVAQGFTHGTILTEVITDFEIKDGILQFNLDKEKFEILAGLKESRRFESLSSCELVSYTSPIMKTLEQVPGIEGFLFEPSPI